MARKTNTPKAANRRPKPQEGASSYSEIFQAVGLSLHNWEKLEMEMAAVFRSLSTDHFIAWTGYSYAVERTKLLKESIERRIADPALKAELMALLNEVDQFRERRNDIAHGHVVAIEGNGHYLVPSTLAPRKWDNQHAAKHQWSDKDIMYYSDSFFELCTKCADLRQRAIEHRSSVKDSE